ncbi:unnamed protein product [Penicillium nalgiovense]|uniref:Uncharacterized protein n=1 Tax=Penicillium nalgiovense TaxID=60175 RepID=A0A9W4HT07_PENNA|nr:unnamed protein product [Penicillium nalgiovense]CAG7941858.1 unnamed protein product [Penicillium nalgiovense]CAG7953641.1 unnamed protein product [Penicillium nalgiovense]CAG7962376.1 unnamed protein product [Penicillium nalgiovense]CAG8086564.1 unnamed protein product [Penicillium nalgiovense]
MYVASTIASIVSEGFVYLINTNGNPYGVSASHGDYFLKLSWYNHDTPISGSY